MITAIVMIGILLIVMPAYIGYNERAWYTFSKLLSKSNLNFRKLW